MIDLDHLEKYHENNRIEAKKALGGLPHSIWETYSAFANTLGGLILLGVEEYRDKSFHPVDLPDPEALVREFWELINRPGKASVNILAAKDVVIEEVDGCRIIVIRVPRAQRREKPVYVDGDTRNCYRRSGEGDYRCTPEEYDAMVRDAAVRTQDMQVLQDMSLEALSLETCARYRALVDRVRPDTLPGTVSQDDFLVQIGAAETDADGIIRPNGAGLLMFGKAAAIREVYPDFRLEYRDEGGENVFDFCENVCARLKSSLPVPELYPAIREALVNCLVHADYLNGPVTVGINAEGIVFSNPGIFRIDVAAAKNGGLSDPRNSALMHLFRLADIGEGSGSGVPGIFRVSRELGLKEPVISESLHPDRTTVTISFEKADGAAKKRRPGAGQDRGDERHIRERRKNDIILFLTDRVTAGTKEIAEYLNISAAGADELLTALLNEEIVVSEQKGRKKIYRLRS